MSIPVRRPPPRVTLADFLEWPGDGTAKHYQLVDGEIRAMSPGSTTHGSIQSNIGFLITRRLTETRSPCRVLITPGVVPNIRSNANFRIPDLGVTCSPDRPGVIILPDPILLVEVLSPGNESDTRENVWAYTTLPSVREILIVHSTRVAAEVLRRQADGFWPADPEMLGAGDTLRLDTVDLACPLGEVFARTHLG